MPTPVTKVPFRWLMEKPGLMRDDFCDGLGDCLPACPTNAITFEEREADAYDDDAVKAHLCRQRDRKHLRNTLMQKSTCSR